MAGHLYDLLGIPKTASPEEVRRAYRQKALETHPDKILDPEANDEEKRKAEARFHEIYRAFEVLSDTSRRRAYDVSMDIKVDYTRYKTDFSEAQLRRTKEREEWAHNMEAQHQARMRAHQERCRARDEAYKQMEREAKDQADMVEKMLQELLALDPEWEARRKHVQRDREKQSRARTRTY